MTLVLKQSLKAVLHVSRWFGMAPVKKLHEPRVSKAFRIYGVLLFFCAAALIFNETIPFIVTSIKNEDLDWRNNNTAVILVILMLKELFLFGYMTIKGPRRMTDIIAILHQLEKVKEKRSHITDKKGKKKIYYLIVALMIMISMVQINTFFFDMYDRHDDFLNNFKIFMLTCFIRYAINISVLQFVLVALLIHNLLSSNNDDLDQMFNEDAGSSKVVLYNKPSKVAPYVVNKISSNIDCFGLTTDGAFGPEALKSTSDKTKGGEKIRSISRVYIYYCTLARRLNDCEDIVLLVYVFILSYNLARCLMNTMRYNDYLSHGLTWFSVAAFLRQVLAACTIGIQLLLLVEPSYKAQIELKKTTLLVSKALNKVLERNDFDQLSELQHLLKMLHFIRPVYCAFGVFNIGRPLVMAVLSGIATMLVMIQ